MRLHLIIGACSLVDVHSKKCDYTVRCASNIFGTTCTKAVELGPSALKRLFIHTRLDLEGLSMVLMQLTLKVLVATIDALGHFEAG